MVIVYMFVFLCGAFYIDNTMREFSIRVQEHSHAAAIGDIYSPIGKHIAVVHKYKVHNFKYIPLSHPDPRGGDWDTRILQEESKWIFSQNACLFSCLNGQISFKPFLRKLSILLVIL